MSRHKNSLVNYSEGAVNVTFYNWKKFYSSGKKVKIRISSQMKLTKSSYCWDDGERIEINHLLNNNYLFKVRVPSRGEHVLKVITEVQFQDGFKMEFEHICKINNALAIMGISPY